MKKLLLICFLIMGFFLAAGCISGEKSINPETSTESQLNQKSNVQKPGLIIQPGDTAGLALADFNFYAFPKNSPYNITNYYSIKKYKDILPANTRNVGQISAWRDDSGREISIEIIKLDSNSKFDGYFDIKAKFFEEKMNEEQDFLESDVGYPDIGDSSYYYYAVPRDHPDIAGTRLEFARKNYIGLIRVTDNKENSLNEAIRIARTIESRLD